MPDSKEKNVIRLNTDIDPRTDPNSPQFDPEIPRQKKEEAYKRMKQELARITNSLQETPFTSANNVEEIIDAIFALIFNSYDLYGLLDSGEISRAEYDQTMMAILQSITDSGDAPPAAFLDDTEGTFATVIAKRAERIEYPLDKVNSAIWRLLEQDTAGQIAIAAEKRGSKKEISILYSINFDNLGDEVTISKRLLPFDKRVYIAVSALFNAGNNVISLTQIHYAMGNTSRPKAGQLQRINEAIKKMNGAAITVDNSQEIAANYKYMQFKYEGSLLPLERIEASVNGQLTDAAIHIFREPPVITFAKKRNQITTIPVKLLQSPMNKTDANLQLEDYLLERISREARGKDKGKTARLLYKTIFDHAGINTAKQKQRAPEKIEKYLQYYTKTNFIKGYAMEADGITIIFS